MEENKITDKTMDIVEDNIKKLKEIFPEVVTEGKIDFEKLKTTLGEDIETGRERYQFTWHGKTKAIQESQKQGTGTLRPCKEESKNWDSTGNLYIGGDNLEVLKILQKSYLGKIKMIYIDPPYNTGNDFVYHDNYKDNLSNYLKKTGQNNNTTNTESNGRFHTNWLNMMYPRLRLARNLLRDDGVIFISIDDNELNNLKKLCDEIFGEDNFLNNIIIKSNPSGRDYRGIALQHEYILCYSKTSDIELNMVIDKEKKFKYCDEYGGFDLREIRNRNIKFNIDNRPNLYYPFYVNPNSEDDNGLFEISLIKNDGYVKVYPLKSQGVQTVWRWGKEKSKKNLNINLKAKLKKDGTFMIVEKYRNVYKRERSIWDEKTVRNEAGSLSIKSLFDLKPFDYPKSIDTLKRLVSLGSNNQDIVLDFFSGSATTAEAVMKLNNEDGRNRKFIMVQLPEPTDEKSTAFKAGYSNICEIGKERIRRAGDKIAKESNNTDLDIGFKVFKLDSSNLKPWDPDDDLQSYLIKYAFNVKDDRTNEDLLYEIMLKYGIDLSSKIEEHVTDSNTFYSLGYGSLIVCLDKNISPSIAKSIVEVANPEFCRVVFRDSGFSANNNPDKDKVNMKEYLSNAGVDEFITF